KPGPNRSSGIVMEETCLLSMWCPVYRGRDSNPGFRMERENLAGDAKGKDPSGKNTRSKVPMRGPGADSSVVVMKWGNAHGAKGGGHPDGINGPTGDRRSPLVPAEGGSLQWVTRAV